jgi:iron complex outermembrane recepter protein
MLFGQTNLNLGCRCIEIGANFLAFRFKYSGILSRHDMTRISVIVTDIIGICFVNKPYIFNLKYAAAPLALSLALMSTPSFAQEDASAPKAEEASTSNGLIVVTGSRITRANLELSSPVNVIGAEEIQFRQPTSIEDVLRQLPGSVPGIGSAVNNGSNGTATFNLRGLGANRNLVLINSRRLVPSGTGGVVDLNLLPVALLERAEVLTGGASSVYGADAITGVLNFITKRNFTGLQLDASYGLTERGDGQSLKTDLTIGADLDNGRGNVALSIGYTNTKPVLQGNRAISTFSRSSATGAAQGSPTAVPASILFPLTGAFNPGTGTITGPALSDFNFNPLNVFQTPLRRYNVFAQARYEVSDAVEVFTEASFTRTDVQQRIAPSGTFFNNLRVPLNNQFLTPAQSLQLCTASVGIAGGLPAGTNCATAIAAGTEVLTQIGRRFTEAGPRLTNFVGNTFQITGGARGAINENLDWQVSAQYGQADFTNTQSGQGLTSRLQQSLRGCPTGSSTGCVPINIFGGNGSITPDAFNFINVRTFSFAQSKLTTVEGSVSGDLGFSSPFSDDNVGIAVGAEYRRYTASSGGDSASATAGEVLGAGAPALPLSGSYSSKEVYAEVNVPLVTDRPFFHSLTLEGGFRYSDYSTTGGSSTYKIGGSWAPIEDIKFRGVYSRSVRSPNIGELFQPQVQGLNNLTTDPCQGTSAAVAIRGANFPALCQAQVAAGQFGNIPIPAAGQIVQTTGGNLNLSPEVANTYTLGVVLEPRVLSGLALTADYFNIKIDGAISAPAVLDVINGCFSPTNTSASNPSCLAIQRNPLTGGLSGPTDGSFRGVFRGQTNQGIIETSGIDIGLNYRSDLGPVNLTINSNITYTIENLFQATPVSINRECVGYYSVSCGNPQPEWQWNVRTTVGFASGTDVSLFWRHLGGVNVEPVAPTPQVFGGVPTTGGPATVFAAYRSIPSYDYFDLSFRQSIGDNLQFTLTAQNLFDKDAPDVGNTIGGTGPNSGNTFPSVYDALGRRYTAAIRLKF